MKNQKRVLLITVLFLFFGMVAATAQEKNPQTVIIRAFELPSKASHMTVTNPEGTIQTIELSVVDLKTFEGASGNSELIQAQINEWKKQGFVVDGLSTLSSLVGGIITTIVLSKD